MSSSLDEAYGAVTSRYYDATYAQLRHATGDAAFYTDLARKSRGPVLELGCGTGRVLLPIARRGIECVGLDASQSMLDALRAKSPPENVTLHHGPMQGFELDDRRFALIFSAFRAMQHLTTVEDQLNCLASVRAHLQPSGRFAFDVFAPRYDLLSRGTGEESVDAEWQEDGARLRRTSHVVEHNPARQEIRVRFRYERAEPDGAVANAVAEARMRYFFRYEVEHLLARAGFVIEALHGAFDGRPYDHVSGEMVVIARCAVD